MKLFHAHVYFTGTETTQAYDLSYKAKQTKLFDFIKLHERAVGPHPTPMIEMHFSSEHTTAPAYEQVKEWLNKNRGTLSVLIHEETGDDFKDHSQNILWLGQAVPLDFGFFTLIQTRPDLKVHK